MSNDGVDLYKEINGLSGRIELRAEMYVVKRLIELVLPFNFKAPVGAVIKADADLPGRMFDVRGDGVAKFRGGFTIDGNRAERKKANKRPDLIRLWDCEGHLHRVNFKDAPRIAVRFKHASGSLKRCGFDHCTLPVGPSTVQLGDGASDVLIRFCDFAYSSFIDAVDTHGLRIFDNRFRWGNKAVTLETVRQGPCTDAEIERNKILDMLWGGVYVGGARNVGVRHNEVRRIGAGVKRWHGNGVRVHACGGWQPENVTVEENLVRACAKQCIYPPKSRGTITIGINDTRP